MKTEALRNCLFQKWIFKQVLYRLVVLGGLGCDSLSASEEVVRDCQAEMGGEKRVLVYGLLPGTWFSCLSRRVPDPADPG